MCLMVTAGTPAGGDLRRFTRRKSSAEALDQSAHESRSPTGYDWYSLFP